MECDKGNDGCGSEHAGPVSGCSLSSGNDARQEDEDPREKWLEVEDGIINERGGAPQRVRGQNRRVSDHQDDAQSAAVDPLNQPGYLWDPT